MEKYKALVAAVKILSDAQLNVYREELDSPAWEMILRVKRYLQAQASAEFKAVSA